MQQDWRVLPSRVVYLKDASHHGFQFPAVVELFRYVVNELDLELCSPEKLSKLIATRPSNAPTRPHRVCLVGAPAGAGETLAREYGLVHVRGEALERLGQEDCRLKGWVVEGQTAAEVAALRGGPHWAVPSRVISFGESEITKTSKVDPSGQVQTQIQRILDHPLQ